MNGGLENPPPVEWERGDLRSPEWHGQETGHSELSTLVPNRRVGGRTLETARRLVYVVRNYAPTARNISAWGETPRKRRQPKTQGLKARDIDTLRVSNVPELQPEDYGGCERFPGLQLGLLCYRAIGALERILPVSSVTTWVVR